MGLGSVWFGHMALFVRSFVLICLLWQTREDRFGSMCSLTCRLLGILLCPYCVTSSIDETNVMSKKSEFRLHLVHFMLLYNIKQRLYLFQASIIEWHTSFFIFKTGIYNWLSTVHFRLISAVENIKIYVYTWTILLYSVSFKTFKCSMLYTNVFPDLTSPVII